MESLGEGCTDRDATARMVRVPYSLLNYWMGKVLVLTQN